MAAERSKQPLVTFIIVCWNNRDLLEECFQSIDQQKYKQLHTIVVDNGSTDNSVSYIRSRHPKIELIETGKNNGFAIGNNIGIAHALKDPECQYVVLLNTDARLSPDWVEQLVAFAVKHPKGAAFQSPTVDYYDHNILDSRGLTFDHRGRAVQLGYREQNPNLKTKQVFGVNAAAAMFSRAFLEDQPFGTDYFDSDMWMYSEDVDIAARAIITGWQNWFVNKSCAYHMGSASSSGNPGFSIFMSYRNNTFVLVKNFPWSMILRILPGLIVTDVASIYRHIKGRNYIAIKAMIRARCYSLLHLRVYLAKRQKIKSRRVISNHDLWLLMRPD